VNAAAAQAGGSDFKSQAEGKAEVAAGSI